MSESDDDKSSSEGAKPPNKGAFAKRNRLSGPVKRALEDLCYSLWEAHPDPVVRDALVRWKARNL